ncbi:MAG: GntR family transcriptional regulator [Candidatus Aminicenantes bacterium]|nr:GntR family transcriptional regulator [Candidatus Aminicenantes bacterium]MDH5714817.1 GntR family transcriptional regulator [Candidatus Aminicenantes bacterium]
MNGNLLGYKTLKECVYDYLSKELESGNLKPGETIDEKELCERLNVSRTPIREALIQLETEGFVKILTRRHIYVNELNLDDIANIYQVIGALEAAAAERALERMTDKHIAELEKLCEKMKKALEKGDFSKHMDYNLKTHELFLKLNDNELLAKIVILLKKRLYDFPEIIKEVPEWDNMLIKQHTEMVELCKKGDKKGLNNLLKDIHWSFEKNRSYIISYYSKNNN